MAFQLYKSLTGTVPAETFIATAAIAIGDVVKLAAGDSGVGRGKITKITGGASDSDIAYGVAVSAATSSGDLVQVIPIAPGQTWVADAAANTNATNIGLVTSYIDTSMKVAVGGTITNLGDKVVIVGVLGAAANKKYLVRFNLLDTLWAF